MKVRKTDKAHLIEVTGQLFRTRGFHNTSISDIAKACDLSKGSVYHYITSKIELAIDVVNHFQQNFKQRILSIAYQENKSRTVCLEEMCDAIINFYTDKKGGSLMGNLVLEVTDTVPELKGLLQSFFSGWIDAFTHLLTGKYGPERARQLAEEGVSQIQGALMLARLYNDFSVFRRSCQNFARYLEECKV